MCRPSATTPPLLESSDQTPSAINHPSTIPSDALSRAAYHHAHAHLHPAILNHSLRVAHLARTIALRENSPCTKSPLLFTAAILHDLGTSTAHDGPQRFEVEGADFASSLVTQHGFSASEAHEVWVAIALHTSPGIAERISSLARLIRLAVLIDFTFAPEVVRDVVGDEGVMELEERLPRLGIEMVLGDAVVEQAVRRPEKAPGGSWPGNLVGAWREDGGGEGVNRAF